MGWSGPAIDLVTDAIWPPTLRHRPAGAERPWVGPEQHSEVELEPDHPDGGGSKAPVRCHACSAACSARWPSSPTCWC